MKIPYVGYYCEGCFDSIKGIPEGSSLYTISGGFDNPEDKRKWLLIIAIYDKSYEINEIQWGIPPHNLFPELEKIKIYETKTFTSKEINSSTTYNIRRIEDAIIEEFKHIYLKPILILPDGI